ncbi:TPA: hypothetical protein ACY4RW_001271 [Clostridium perfringens]
MILEAMLSAALGGALYGYIQSKDKKNEKIKLEKDNIEQFENMKIWKKCLELSDTKGIVNKNNDTFTLENYKKTEYGFTAITKAPFGLDWMSLRSVENALETNFKGTVEITKEKYSDEIKVEVITRKPEFDFKPVKLTCDEWFGGFKANGTPFNISLFDNPHILYAGKTGSGKTFAMFISFTNMLYNYKNDFDVYITQLVNAETKIFSKTKPCKMTASNLEEALVVLEKIVSIADQREKEISKYGYVSVRHFNEDHPNKKYKRIFLLMDEFSFFKQEDGDSEEDKKLKNKCEICLKRIAKAGRSMNITIIASLQKATVENINSSVRSQMCMISLRQFSGSDSKITIGTTEASRLDDCEAIIKGSSIYEKVFIPIIKSKQPQIELQKYDKNIIVPRKGVIIEDVVKEKEEKLKCLISTSDDTIENNVVDIKTTAKKKPRRNIKGA